MTSAVDPFGRELVGGLQREVEHQQPGEDGHVRARAAHRARSSGTV